MKRLNLLFIKFHLIQHKMSSKKLMQPKDSNTQLQEIGSLTKIQQPMTKNQFKESHHSHLKHDHHHDHLQKNIQKFLDMQTINPDWKFASKHGQSTKPGFKISEEDHEECICCLRPINKRSVPLCENSKQLQFLGYGFPLYFIFLKYTAIILLVEIVNYTALQLYLSIQENYDFCVNHNNFSYKGQVVHCTSFMVLFANIITHLSDFQLMLRLSSFGTLLLALIYIRDNFTKTWMYYDERETSYADFSLMIKNIPIFQKQGAQDIPVGQRLKNFFNDEDIFPRPSTIAKINLIGQFEKYEELEHQKKHLIQELLKEQILNAELKKDEKVHPHQHDAKRNEVREKKKQLKTKIHHLQQQISQEKTRLKAEILNENLRCDTAIVCFETEDQMTEIQGRLEDITPEQYQKHFGPHGAQVQIEQAPQPHQINWENINVSQGVITRRAIISWLIFILILAVLTTGVYFLFSFKSHQVLHASQAGANAIVFCSLIAIIFFNKFVLSYVIHHLVEIQLHKTGESSQFSFMLKYSLGLFFTTALMTILVQGITHDNVFTEKYGIVEEQTIMFFFNAFLVPLIWLINPWYLWKLSQRKLHQNSPHMTQQKANKLMEDPEYLMGKRYGQILQSLWFTYLYSCVIPFGSILTLIGLTLYYWVDKYNLLRKSSILEGVSGNLCMRALFLMQFTLILKPAGQLIFDGLIRDQWNVIPVVQICVGSLYIFIPIKSILGFLHPQKFLSSESSYTQLKEKKFSSYELYNPITKEQSLKVHFQKIQTSTMKQKHDQSPLKGQPSSLVGTSRKLQKKHSIVRPHLMGRTNSPNKNGDIQQFSDISIQVVKPTKNETHFAEI